MDSRIQKMAQVLIHYSTAVKAGDRVLLRGTSSLAQPLMQALYEEALAAGAEAFNYVHLSEEKTILLGAGSTAQIETVNPMLKLMYDTADVIIRIEAEQNTQETAGFPKDIAVVAQSRFSLRGVFLRNPP